MGLRKRGICSVCKRLVAATQPLGANSPEPIAIVHGPAKGLGSCAGSRKPVEES